MRKSFFCMVTLMLLQACNKNAPSPVDTPSPVVPVTTEKKTKVAVFIDNVPMKISVLNYNRASSTLTIEAENISQKVGLYVSNFYQNNPYSYICNYEVTYSTRADSLKDWNKYPVNHRNEYLTFNNFAPLTDSIVRGDFSVFYEMNKKPLQIKADFYLVFK